jgi:uncharacterized protein (DUF362 family)
MISRRLFLGVVGSGLVALAAGGGDAMARFFGRSEKKAGPRLAENRFVDKGKALVGISVAGSVEEMVDEAVALIGGFERLDLKGRTVLVKPNVVSGEKNPSTTNPEVVASVVRLLYRNGAKKVYVGDMSALSTLSTMRNFRRSGIKAAAEESGAEVVAFEDFGWVEVSLPDNEFVKKALVTEWIFNVDLVVNLPVVKTHRSATYSITLKNFIGCTHLKQRPYLIDSSHWEEIVAEFNAAYAPELNIVDGTVSMIEGGPWSGTPRETNVIIASGDRVGADVAGLGLIKSFGRWAPVVDADVWEQRQIKRALEVGAGSEKGALRLVSGIGDRGFTDLVRRVREHSGL